MKRFIYFCFFFLISITSIFAYPISPRPLRQLVIESEYIIVGYVKEIIDNGKKETIITESNISFTHHFGNKTAKISILEQLQGKIKEKNINIVFEPNMICPAPAEYYANTYVIAFLDKEKGEYTTHALSYGAKTLSKTDIEIYKKRILEIQEILKYTNQSKQFVETVEWLVKCAENHVTSWEGTYELHPQSHFMSMYSRKPFEDFSNILTFSQKERLKKAFFDTETISNINLGLMGLVYINNEKEIDTFLLKLLKSVKSDSHELWVAYQIIQELNQEKKIEALSPLLSSLRDSLFGASHKEEEAKKIIDECIKLLE